MPDLLTMYAAAKPDDVAVVQALELANGGELHALVYDAALAVELPGKPDPRRVIDRLYRAVLSRPATAAEKNAGRAFMKEADEPEVAVKDMFWALVCSPEFQYIK